MRTPILFLVTTTALLAQPTTFEVASFKRVEPAEMERLAAAERSGQVTGAKVGFSGGPGTNTPARFLAEYVSLARLISRAYDLKPYQFRPPEWMGTERYRLDAKLPLGITEDQFRLILQNLLTERLDLKVHWQTKEMPVYELSASKAGVKFDATEAERRQLGRVPEGYPSLPAGEEPALNVQRGRAVWRARGETMEQTAAFASAYLNRPVIDTTGLHGKYSFTLFWVQNTSVLPADAETSPSLAEAIQEQLGLKLVPKERRNVEVLIVDHAEKMPHEN